MKRQSKNQMARALKNALAKNAEIEQKIAHLKKALHREMNETNAVKILANTEINGLRSRLEKFTDPFVQPIGACVFIAKDFTETVKTTSVKLRVHAYADITKSCASRYNFDERVLINEIAERLADEVRKQVREKITII